MFFSLNLLLTDQLMNIFSLLWAINLSSVWNMFWKCDIEAHNGICNNWAAIILILRSKRKIMYSKPLQDCNLLWSKSSSSCYRLKLSVCFVQACPTIDPLLLTNSKVGCCKFGLKFKSRIWSFFKKLIFQPPTHSANHKNKL